MAGLTGPRASSRATIAFTPDGRYAYVACELDSTVYVIDVGARKVRTKLAAGEFSNGVAVAPDGSRVYVSNGRGASVSVIDTASNRSPPRSAWASGRGTWH
jgi:YVTN family beta-propeller protein